MKLVRLFLRTTPWCLLAVAGTALAHPDDTVQFNAGYNVTHDSNLFRLPKTANAQTVLGRGSAAETVETATGSLILDKNFGMQRVNVNASVVDYRYTNFSYLSFTAFNYAALWDWRLTPRFRGSLTSDRRQTLTSYADFLQSYSTRNVRTESSTRFTGLYELDGAWQLTGGASRNELENSNTLVQARNYLLHSVDVGVKRTFSSNSQVTYRLRKGSGDYKSLPTSVTASLPSNFSDLENEVSLRWQVTAKSALDGRIAYLRRTHSSFSDRDYSGVNARVNFNWGITSRTAMLVGMSRELGDYQTQTSSYTVTDRLFFEPAWQIKQKLTLRVRQEIASRRFEGALPGFFLLEDRQDTIGLSRLSLEWQPREAVGVSAWLQHDRRSSNQAGFDFTSNSVGLAAQLSF